MKKRYSAIIIAIATAFLLSAVVVWSQPAGETNPPEITNPPEMLSIDLLEDPALWAVYISNDDGYSVLRSFNESVQEAIVPLDNTPLDDNAPPPPPNNENVLGIKTEFIKRGFTEIFFNPLRPIPIPGEVTHIDLQVYGRNLQYEFCVRVRDINLKTRELCSAQKLNFETWEQVTVQIPLDVQQYDPRRPLDTGLEFVSIVVKPLFTEAYGTHYVYFDDMRATTNVSRITALDTRRIVDIDAW